MISANSKNNVLIRLTDERISHIFNNHPETKDCITWFIIASINKKRRIVWKP